MYSVKNIIFVSEMPILMPDIYWSHTDDPRYCANINKSSRFVVARKDTMYEIDSIISTVYARLEDWTTVIIMEMFRAIIMNTR